MSTDDGKRLAQLHDAMQDRIKELEEALRDVLDFVSKETIRHARYVLAKAGPR